MFGFALSAMNFGLYGTTFYVAELGCNGYVVKTLVGLY